MWQASAQVKKTSYPAMASLDQYLIPGKDSEIALARSAAPHLMFLVLGDAARSWGANLPGSPVIAANDPEEDTTIFMIWVANWSDGTPGPLY